MKEYFKQGTHVMGMYTNPPYSSDERPFEGIVQYYDSYECMYEIKMTDKMYLISVHKNGVSLYIKEIFELATKLWSEAKQMEHEIFELKKQARTLAYPNREN